MNAAFWHLAVNHIPVLALPFGFLLLAAGLYRNNRDLTQAGFVTLMAVGLLAYPIMKTGAKAAHFIWGMPGFTRDSIMAHGEAADDATWAAIALGVVALIGFITSKKSNTLPKLWAMVALLGALGGSVWMGYVAHLGGLIRHPEIEKGFVPAPTPLLPDTSQGHDH